MKKLFLLTLSIGILVSCQPEKQPVVFSGQITNPLGSRFEIIGNDVSFKIEVDEDGNFSDTLDLTSGYYTFSHGEITALYLEPGYNIYMTLDTDAFDETIEYTGIGSAPNNYLKTKYLLDETLMPGGKPLFILDEFEFAQKLLIQRDTLEKTMKSMALPAYFVELENKSNYYRYLSMLSSFSGAHRYYTNNPEYQMSDSLMKPILELDYNNEEDYKNFPDYKYLLTNHYLYSKDLSNQDSLKKALTDINMIGSQAIKSGLAEAMIGYLSPSSKNLDLFYSGIKDLTNDSAILANSEQNYEATIKILPGKPSPYFKYVTNKGDSLALDDFRGKPIYIDIWATWCGPCIQEIPFLKEVEAQFGEEVHFISISIDDESAIQKWKDMIADRELTGTHLYAEGEWEASIMKDYSIFGIPRFILLNKEGVIINADAPRPSNENLKELLTEAIES